tara:strand:- start:927 stop:1742 length:816 start_codon:yes stop_codon:yes gene_type:complete
MKIKILAFAALLLGLQACDEIPEDEYLLIEGGSQGYQGTGHRVFLEEFTGVKCNNCPAANQKAKNLQAIYGKENLILIGIHAGNLATTDAEHPKAFNTPEGTELFNFFQLFGVPVGFVNRLDYDENRIIKGEGDWAGLVATELERQPVAEINLAEDRYNAGTMELTVSGNVNATGTLPDNIKVCLYLTENDIVSAQTLGDKSVNPNYVHDHVFRGSFSGTYGKTIDLSSGSASFTESITLPSDAVKANCEVIAFIYDADNYEILQSNFIEI